MTDAPSDFDRTYMRVLGQVLREHRKRKGWVRRDLHRALRTLPDGAVEVSLQTLATYELGTRQCSVLRLAQIAKALGTRPSIILAEVDRRVFAADDAIPAVIKVNMPLLAGSDAVDLVPAARWAASRLADGQPPVHNLILPALEQLAALCALDLPDMITALGPYRMKETV